MGNPLQLGSGGREAPGCPPCSTAPAPQPSRVLPLRGSVQPEPLLEAGQLPWSPGQGRLVLLHTCLPFPPAAPQLPTSAGLCFIFDHYLTNSFKE